MVNFLKMLEIVDLCVMMTFLTLTSTILQLLLHTSILPRMDFNIYSSNILTCNPIRNTFKIPLFLGLQLKSSLFRQSFGEKRPEISMVPYSTTRLMKIYTSSNHLERV